MSARIVVLFALVAVLAATAVLLFTDSYTGSSCSANGASECTSTGSTLIEENGRGVLLVLAVPVLLVACVAALVWLRGPRWIEIPLAVVLAFACMISLASIGFLYLPAAGLALVAVALDSRITVPIPEADSE